MLSGILTRVGRLLASMSYFEPDRLAEPAL